MSKKNMGKMAFQMKVTNHITDEPTEEGKETTYSIRLKPMKVKAALTTIKPVTIASSLENIFSEFPDKQIIEVQFVVSQKSLKDFQEEKGKEEEEEETD